MKNNITILCFISEKSPDYHRYYALFHTGNRGFGEGDLPNPQGFVPKYITTLTSDELCSILVQSHTGKGAQTSEAINLLNVMSCFRFGSCGFNVFNGMLDYYHPHHRITFKFDSGSNSKDKPKPTSKERGFGKVPESGQYSDAQKLTYWLLCHLPFHTGRVEIAYQYGEPTAVVMETNNYIRIER